MGRSIRTNLTWFAIPVAGIVAGTVFLFTNLILAPVVLEIEPTLILRYIGSLILGSEVLIEDDIFTLAVGLVLHYILAIFYALVIAVVVHRWGLLVGVIGGAILGLAIYGINLYTFTLLFDWFFAMHSNVLLLGHVLYGAVAGGTYELFDEYDVAFPFGVDDETA